MFRGDGAVSSSVWIITAVILVLLLACVTVGVYVMLTKNRQNKTAPAPVSGTHRTTATPVAIAVAPAGGRDSVIMATETGVRRTVTVNAAMIMPPASAVELDAVPVATATATVHRITAPDVAATVSGPDSRTVTATGARHAVIVNGEIVMPSGPAATTVER